MENRQKILTQKAKEIRIEIEKWAEQNLPLCSNEFITVVLTIEKRPTTVIKHATVRRPRTKATDKAITNEDWEKLLSLPLSRKQKAIVDFFKENNNKPLLPTEIEELLGKNDFGPYCPSSQIEMLNLALCNLEVNYRLRKVEHGGYWETGKKFVIVE